MLTANALKGKLERWLVTMINATLKTPIHKFEKPIFSFRRTHEAAVRNSRILTDFKGTLGAAIAAHKDIPVNYGP